MRPEAHLSALKAGLQALVLGVSEPMPAGTYLDTQNMRNISLCLFKSFLGFYLLAAKNTPNIGDGGLNFKLGKPNT